MGSIHEQIVAQKSRDTATLGKIWNIHTDIQEPLMQGWKFVLFALWIKIAQIKERPWAICSGCSWKKSDLERIAQVALNKRATVSDLLKSLFCHEQFTQNNVKQIVFFRMFFTVFPLFMPKS